MTWTRVMLRKTEECNNLIQFGELRLRINVCFPLSMLSLLDPTYILFWETVLRNQISWVSGSTASQQLLLIAPPRAALNSIWIVILQNVLVCVSVPVCMYIYVYVCLCIYTLFTYSNLISLPVLLSLWEEYHMFHFMKLNSIITCFTSWNRHKSHIMKKKAPNRT